MVSPTWICLILSIVDSMAAPRQRIDVNIRIVYSQKRPAAFRAASRVDAAGSDVVMIDEFIKKQSLCLVQRYFEVTATTANDFYGLIDLYQRC